MAEIFTLDTFSSPSGHLTVYNNTLPGDVKRVFYIYGAGGRTRGGHRHHKAWNTLICIAGRCRIYVHNGEQEQEYVLDSPTSCLVLEPKDWHVMHEFSTDAVLLVLSNEPYDLADYIDKPYANCRYAQLTNR
jgi:dTDP-4-dehydrorhamnose 3,5-epimerase-like enzyme